MFFSKKKKMYFPIKVLQIVPRYFVIFVTLFSRICVVYSSGLLMVGERYGNLGSSDYYKKNTIECGGGVGLQQQTLHSHRSGG